MEDYLRFVKADPCGNTTAFILDPVAKDRRAKTAQAVMEALHVEQMGYSVPPRDKRALGRLEMMGGEFCGNASRSFAAWLIMGGADACGNPVLSPLKNQIGGQAREVMIELSGHEGLLWALLEDGGILNGCIAAIDMPLPLELRHGRHPALGPYSLACFEGIIHAVLWGKAPDESDRAAVRRLIIEAGYPAACYGLLYIDEAGKHMRPFVVVEAVGTAVWESSCGSGTVAVACAMLERSGRDALGLTLHQPGGALSASVRGQAGVCVSARLKGEVAFPALGRVFVSV